MCAHQRIYECVIAYYIYIWGYFICMCVLYKYICTCIMCVFVLYTYISVRYILYMCGLFIYPGVSSWCNG